MVIVSEETGYKQDKKEIEIVEIIFYVDKGKLIFTLPLARIATLRLFNKINITEESGNMD